MAAIIKSCDNFILGVTSLLEVTNCWSLSVGAEEPWWNTFSFGLLRAEAQVGLVGPRPHGQEITQDFATVAFWMVDFL